MLLYNKAKRTCLRSRLLHNKANRTGLRPGFPYNEGNRTLHRIRSLMSRKSLVIKMVRCSRSPAETWALGASRPKSES